MINKQPLTHLLISVTKKYLSIFSQQTKGLDIERYQYVLVLLDNNDERLSQKDLCEILEVDKSFMVNIINYLSLKGYVYRETNERDKRQQLIKLTDKARKEIPVIRRVIDKLNTKSLENLTESQIQNFTDVLLQLRENLEEIKPKGIRIKYSEEVS